MQTYFSGTLRLLRLNLRRDRLQIPLWLIGLAGTSVVVAAAFTSLFPTVQDRQIMAETMRNPAMIAMIGPSAGLDHYTIGAMFGHEMTLFTALAAAIMGIMLTARHTRGDEEDGRLELIRGLPVGRLSPLAATMIEMLLISLLITLTNGLGLTLLGIKTMPLTACLLYGASLGTTTLVFAAITAIFAQLAITNRGTISFSLTFLGISYLLRASTDLSNESLSWLSPIAWSTKAEVFVNNHWLPIWLSLLFALVVTASGYYLNSIRDLDAGFIPQRSGKKHASKLLQTPFGLSLRLLRTTLIAWLVASLILGASYGSVFGDIEDFFKNSELIKMLLPKSGNFSLAEQFMTILMVIFAILSSIPALTAVLKLVSEEHKGRIDQVLSKPVSRTTLLSGYAVIGFAVGTLAQFLAIIGLYLAATSVMDKPITFAVMLRSGLSFLPAIWFVTALGVLLVGWLPKFTSFVWIYLVFSFFVDYLGNMLDVPKWLKAVSPYDHIPRIPVDVFTWTPLVGLTLLAIALFVIGAVGYRRRDIQ